MHHFQSSSMLLENETNIILFKIWNCMFMQFKKSNIIKDLPQSRVGSLPTLPTLSGEIFQPKRQLLSNFSCLFWLLLKFIFINICELLPFELLSYHLLTSYDTWGLRLLCNLPLCFCSLILPNTVILQFFNILLFDICIILSYAINCFKVNIVVYYDYLSSGLFVSFSR